MPKKIFDILPPKSPPKVGHPPTYPEEKPKPPPERAKETRLPGGSSIFFKKWGTIFSLFALISVFLLCHFKFSKAEIEIWPVTEIKTFKTKLTINKAIEKIDVLNKAIPGKLIEVEKIITEEFPSSGKTLKEKKAEGIIRVYNNYSTSPQTLLATTRFVSADGKLFRSVEKVTIPGGRYEKGKFLPGEIDVKVVADQAGPEYNIGPTTFSIPGFAGTDKYTKFYGKSFQAMSGGLKEEVPQLRQEDLDKAKEVLSERALKESEASLKEKISSEFILLPGSMNSEILETFSFAKPKEEIEKFKFQVKAKSRALVFKKEDLENFARDFILSQVLNGKKLYPPSLKINYSPENINLGAGKIILNLEMEGKIYSEIDEISLKKGLAGKSLVEAKISLENQPLITRTEIKVWPFWLKRIPQEWEKIKIELRIDSSSS